MGYNADMKEQYTTMRIWVKTQRKMRFIHAYTGESMVSTMDRLATEELERVRAEAESATSFRAPTLDF